MTIHAYVHDHYFGCRKWGDYLNLQSVTGAEGHREESLHWDGNTFTYQGAVVSTPSVIFFHRYGFEEGNDNDDERTKKMRWLIENKSFGVLISGSDRRAPEIDQHGHLYKRCSKTSKQSYPDTVFQSCVARFFAHFINANQPNWALLEPDTPPGLWVTAKIVTLLGLQGDAADKVMDQARIDWQIRGWGTPPNNLLQAYAEKRQAPPFFPLTPGLISPLRHSWLDYLENKSEDFLVLVRNDPNEMENFLGTQRAYISKSRKLTENELLGQLNSSMKEAGCFAQVAIDEICTGARKPAAELYASLGNQLDVGLNTFNTALEAWGAAPDTDKLENLKQQAREIRKILERYPG